MKKTSLFKQAILVLGLLNLSSQVQDTNFAKINGVGYLEDEEKDGISHASMAGGTEIMITGAKFNPQANFNLIKMYSSDFDQTFYGQELSGSNLFRSKAGNSKLQYTLPSLSYLLDLSEDQLAGTNWIRFSLQIESNEGTGIITTLNCKDSSSSRCNIDYSRSYTPLLYQVNPPISYYGQLISLMVDPKSVHNIQDTSEGPFNYVKLGSSLLDYEDYYDSTSTLSSWSINQILGEVGDIQPALDNTPLIHFDAGYALNLESTLLRCNYDESDCYHVRSLPSIDSLSASGGYTSGGQLLSINGHEFFSNDVQVDINGVPCEVRDVTSSIITCETGAMGSATIPGNYVGQHGLKETIYEGYVGSSSYYEQVTLHSESLKNLDGDYGRLWQGYFVAPATTDYKFYLSCDDSCEFSLSTDASPDNLLSRLTSVDYSDFRDYFSNDQMTDWISLTQGQHYYLEVSHEEHWGSDHVTLSVEIKKDSGTHHNQMREVQRLQINPTNVREQSQIIFENPDGGEFDIYYYKSSVDRYGPYSVSSTATESEMRSAIKSYFSSEYGGDIEVTLEMFDASELLVLDQVDSVKNVYTVSFLRARSTATHTQVAVINQGSTATGYGITPENVQLSSAPLSGSFVILCYNLDGTFTNTEDIAYTKSEGSIKNSINEACPSLRDQFIVRDGPLYDYDEDGRDLFISFWGIQQNMNQFEILSSSTDPLLGNVIGYSSTTYSDYSTNVFLEPIPHEYLLVDTALPEVVVTVGGLPVVCPAMNCQFEYQDATALITDAPYLGSTLTITGTGLPTTDISVTLGQVDCIISTATDTSITCDTSETLVAGSHFPNLKDSFGLVPIDGAVVALDVTLTVSSVTPGDYLSPMGGNEILIYGTNFPHSLNPYSTVSVEFTDGTLCTMIYSTSTEMKCKTNEFSTTGTQSVIVSVNGVIDSSQSVDVGVVVATITSITPSSYSPVLKTDLEIVIDSTNYSGDWNKDHFTVLLIPQDSSNKERTLNVYKVDEGTSTLTVRYGGAYSGVYDVKISSSSYGDLNSNGVTFQAVGVVTGFSPSSGSIYGGTILTITGHTFSDDPTDNAVEIGGINCDILSTSEFEIKCRTPMRAQPTAETKSVIVFLKTSEEAVWDVSSDYTWTDTTAELQSITIAFNSGTGVWDLTFDGANFDGSTSDVEVQFNGYTQTVISASSTQVVAQATNVDDLGGVVKLYLPSGSPAIADGATINGNIEPALVSVTPAVGSPAGSTIIMNVQGVGVSTTDLNFVTDSGEVLCNEVEIPSSGVVICKTNELTIADGNAIEVTVGSTAYGCAGVCDYSTSTVNPTITSNSLSGDQVTVTITGSGLLLSGFDAIVTYKGVQASSSTIDSDTQVTATFDYGLPLSDDDAIVSLFYQSQSTEEGHFALDAQPLSNAVVISGSTSSDITCSFAGGCELSVTLNGLASSAASGQASVTVCEEEAELVLASSSHSVAVFKVPAISTIYSIDTYNIQGTHLLEGTYFSSDQDQTSLAHDGDYTVGFGDNDLDDDSGDKDLDGDTDGDEGDYACFIGVRFKSGYVGKVTQMKFFMNEFLKETFADKLALLASNDGSSYTELLTVGEEIHEGWNYYNYDGDEALNYRFYKLVGEEAGSCNVGEFALMGVEAIESDATTFSCSPKVVLTDGSSHDLQSSVEYQSTLTPLLDGISPRYGTVEGGTQVTFSGSNFPTDTNLVTIFIDERPCSIDSAQTNQIVCTTSDRTGYYPNTRLDFFIDGMGNVATQGLLYRYVNVWSSTATWGYEELPAGGDSIWIPAGMHLLVDVDATPILNLVLVEGSLIFAPDSDASHQRTFDAMYIFISAGYMEVGTEEFPYTSKLTITMHGEKADTEIPIYGVKVTAVRNGILDMHGVPRYPTWTELELTAAPGDNTITLHTAVDWVAGEQIVIAPTSYENHEAEVMTIASIDNSNVNEPVITLNGTLAYNHYAGVEYYGSHTLEMRAEVGLLTRNVIYRGDPETSGQNRFGAHIMLHSHGDESLIGRIAYCEFFDVGQAFQLGRYPIHFHLIGHVTKSYIIGNAIHQTYNRAVTIHDVEYLRVIENVAYHTMGHTFFVEDAIETKNYVDGNLAVLTMTSWSLLNTDQTPASFWITNPDNIFRNNHAAGSDRYGFWYDLQPHPTGGSFDPNICPINMKLGEFDNNVAHSNGRYGLRIFHGHVPRTYPCQDIKNDQANNPNDPFHENPLITAEFTNFLGYKNKVNGAIAEKVGDVRFKNFQVVDNLVAGIEFSLTGETGDNLAQIKDALVVGRSANDEGIINGDVRYGIITPRTENFTVNGVDFFNFNEANDATIGSCSHCFHPAATDSGARTVTFKKLTFTNVVQKIKYQEPFRAIFYDSDGSLTGLGSKTWATPEWPHNVKSECQTVAEYDGLICDSSVEVRRIAFDQYTPTYFYGQTMRVIPYDDELLDGMTDDEKEVYLDDLNNYSNFVFRKQVLPTLGWAAPFVTGYKYRIMWGTGIDFTNLRIDLSNRWKSNDENIELVLNFTDKREAVNFIYAGDQQVENDTYDDNNEKYGNNLVLNDTETRLIHTLINGKSHERNPLTMVGIRCVDVCLPSIEDVEVEDTVRYWSDPNSWTSGAVPVEGDDVEVESGWNMILDVDTPILNIVEINGRLTFQDNGDKHFQAKYIFVRAGELLIGSEEEPFTHNAIITLYGLKDNEYIVFKDNIEAGDKILINTGRVEMHGQSRVNYLTRLTETANPGASVIYVESNLDWMAGDVIALAPTTVVYNDSDVAVIVSYDSVNGRTELDRELTGYHWGDSASTASDYNGVDMRGEVFLLNRNIRVEGEDQEQWGCQFITSDFIEEDDVYRAGKTILDNVEIYNCSQYDTFRAALRFEGASYRYSEVKNSAIHHGHGLGLYIFQAENIYLENNYFFDFVRFGVNIQTSHNITMDGNLIINVHARNFEAENLEDQLSAVAICGYTQGDYCSDLHIVNNIMAGSVMYGAAAPGHLCDDDDDYTFANNVVHSVFGWGIAIFPWDGSSALAECLEGSKLVAYKNSEAGVYSFFNTHRLQLRDMTLIDNGNSVIGMIGNGENIWVHIQISDSHIYGETEARDCLYEDHCILDDRSGGDIQCTDKYGALIPYFALAGKPVFPTSSSAFPLHKIKANAKFFGDSEFLRVTFEKFLTSKTYCGKTQAIFAANPSGADYHPPVHVKGSYFVDVNQTAIAYLFSPPMSWSVIDDCGYFPCTGPANIYLGFTSSQFLGSIKPENTQMNFEIAANNENFLPYTADCSFEESWNAYYCDNSNLGVLIFDTLDGDKEKRSFTPVTLYNRDFYQASILNQFMDHIWDGFYTGQLRLNRFPTLIEAFNRYEILYTGTVPSIQRFYLHTESGGVTLKISYLKTGAFSIFDEDGDEIAPNDFDDSTGQIAELSSTPRCGENRFVGIDNYLEFYLGPGCFLQIEPKDAIFTTIRMDWTLDEFYADGGTTKFIDRLAGSLGIHASDVKIVSVLQGSVIVTLNYEPATNRERNKFKRSLSNQIKNKDIDLGAPILDASFGEGDDAETIVTSDTDVEPTVEDTSSSSSSDATASSSSSSNTTTVQVGNSTLVITNSNTNNTGTNSEDDKDDEPVKNPNSNETVQEGFLDASKIAIMCAILGVVLIGLVVIAVVLFKRNKKLSEAPQYHQSQMESGRAIEQSDKKKKMKKIDSDEKESGEPKDEIDVVISDVDVQEDRNVSIGENRPSAHPFRDKNSSNNLSNLGQDERNQSPFFFNQSGEGLHHKSPKKGVKLSESKVHPLPATSFVRDEINYDLFQSNVHLNPNYSPDRYQRESDEYGSPDGQKESPQ